MRLLINFCFVMYSTVATVSEASLNSLSKLSIMGFAYLFARSTQQITRLMGMVRVCTGIVPVGNSDAGL